MKSATEVLNKTLAALKAKHAQAALNLKGSEQTVLTYKQDLANIESEIMEIEEAVKLLINPVRKGKKVK